MGIVDITKKVYIGEWDSSSRYGEIGGILVDKNNNLVLKLRVLNDENNYSGKRINVYHDEIRQINYKDDLTKDEQTRKIDFKEWVEDRIFIFHVYIDEKYIDLATNERLFEIERENSLHGSLNYLAKDITVLKKNEDFDDEYKYEVIPVVNKSELVPNKEKFDEHILNGQNIGLENAGQFGDSVEDMSSFIIFHDDIEKNLTLGFLYENLDVTELTQGYVQYAIPTPGNDVSVRKIDTHKWMSAIYYDITGYDNIMFVPQKYLQFDFLESYTEVNDTLVNTEYSVMQSTDLLSKNIPDNEVNNADENTEDSILKNFKRTVNSDRYNLTYDQQDLTNFYISIKTNMLTILSGLSGTGKSKIVTAFADSLGILNANQFKMISVRPSWQDDSDLLGYADTMNNIYRAADSGLTDLIIRAANDPNNMYLVVLDEMNLSRVEHYFSQFISILERDPAARIITLYNSNIKSLYNRDRYPSSVKIGSNIRFVGTVNIDESTFHFSDKLIDRANIIELQLVPFSHRNKAVAVVGNEQTNGGQKHFLDIINNLGQLKQNRKLSDTELEFLWKLNELFINNLPDSGFGWRVLNSIELFLSAISSGLGLSREEALDYQIAQRILPKLRGTSDAFEKLLGINGDNELTGEINQLFLDNKELSEFKHSKGLLYKKAKELQVTGFAS